MATAYGSCTLAGLKSELGKRGAKKTGRKQELVKRLECYDQNADFRQTPCDVAAYNITTPAETDYRDINANSKVPMVTMDAVEVNLTPFDKKLDDKARNLYSEKFLTCVRMVVKDGQCFILGRCHAEMKKRITYKVDVVVARGGVILECQCECAVGMGPDAHCKHVQCLLIALVSFSKDNEILTAETCTQRLQTFHHCKRFKGSPMKATQLSLRKSDLDRGIRNVADFDPRPMTMVKMEAYGSFF